MCIACQKWLSGKDSKEVPVTPVQHNHGCFKSVSTVCLILEYFVKLNFHDVCLRITGGIELTYLTGIAYPPTISDYHFELPFQYFQYEPGDDCSCFVLPDLL